jgi:hypothetical protein
MSEEKSPSDDWDTEPYVRDEPVEASDPEPKWTVTTMVSWYDGPCVFVAQPPDSPHVLLFRWAGGTSDNRLYESDCHKGMRQPVYVNDSHLDLSQCPEVSKVVDSNASV